MRRIKNLRRQGYLLLAQDKSVELKSNAQYWEYLKRLFPVENFADVKMIGRITRDAEQKFLPSGVAKAETSIAINRSRKNKAGEWETETDYFNLIAWTDVDAH